MHCSMDLERVLVQHVHSSIVKLRGFEPRMCLWSTSLRVQSINQLGSDRKEGVKIDALPPGSSQTHIKRA